MNKNVVIKWGLIFSAVSLLWNTVEFIAGYHTVRIAQHELISAFFIIPAVWVMALGMRDYKIQAGGRITYTQSFMSGIYISIVVAILSAPVQWIFFKFINPNYFDNFITYRVQHGSMSVDAAVAYYNLKSFIVQGLGTGIVLGSVISAVVAAFLRSKSN